MEEVRKPLLIAAAVLCLLAVVADVASVAFIGSNAKGRGDETGNFIAENKMDVDKPDDPGDGPPGLGIPFLAFLDGLLLFNMILMLMSLLVSGKIVGRTQGILTLIVSILLLIGCIVAIILAFVLLLLMIGLFFAFPFGTLAYLALFGGFAKGAAAATITVLFLLKLAFGICLVLAHPTILQNKGLVAMVLTSLLLTFVVAFLHGLVPSFLVSITDAIAAIVVGIVAAIWQIVHLVGSIVSIVKAVA